jgi:hypothetical protein
LVVNLEYLLRILSVVKKGARMVAMKVAELVGVMADQLDRMLVAKLVVD